MVDVTVGGVSCRPSCARGTALLTSSTMRTASSPQPCASSSQQRAARAGSTP